MKIRLLLLAAMMLSSCSGANREAPLSPSPLAESASSPGLLPASAMAVMKMGDADDPGLPEDLSFDVDFGSDLDATVDDVASSVDGDIALPTETSPAGAAPARPVLVGATSKGTTGTVTWKKGSGGGTPTEYFVLHEGKTQSVKLKTTFTFTAAPGRYMIVVYGKNAAGNGLPLTTEVTIGSNDFGFYNGNFLGVGTITRTVGALTCQWTVTHTGTGRLLLVWGTKGLEGQLTIEGAHSVPKGIPIRGNVNCLAGVNPYKDVKPVIISGTNIARTGLAMAYFTGTFSGNLAGKNVTGSLKIEYKNGDGIFSTPLVLKR